MRRSGRTVVLCGCALLACAGSARAQGGASALSVGGRVLAAMPVGGRGAGLETGTGFGVDAGYDVRPGWTVYAGYSRTAFPVEAEGRDLDRVDSGVDVGVRTQRTVGGVPLWLRGGIVFHEAETHLRSGGGDGLDDGKTGVGLESGLGVNVQLGRHLALLPGVAYTAYPVGDPGGVSHLRAEVGVRLRP
jgi:hypothetical protein